MLVFTIFLPSIKYKYNFISEIDSYAVLKQPYFIMKMTTNLIFRNQAQQSTSIISAGLLLLFPSLLSAKQAQTKPNVVFIMTDQQFAEAMSSRMGNEFVRTPNMDQLAADGMVFSRAYCNNPLSMPSRSSMFTGYYTHQTGITKNAAKNVTDNEKYNQELPNLGQYFQSAGYATAYFGKSHLSYDVNNLKESGFELANESDNDSVVSHDAVKYIQTNLKRPFLMVASYTNPHNICEYAREISGRTQKYSCGAIASPTESDILPPLPFNHKPQLNEPDGLAVLRRAYQTQTGLFPVAEFTENDWRKLRWAYYRMMEKVDTEIGLVLKALKDAGLDENTLIVFTSDHGECAGAHGWNQKTVLYEESVRVPFIVRYKGKITSSTTDKLVNTGIDILPTLIDYAGLKIPKNLPGYSLKPILTGKNLTKWRDHVVVETNLAQATGLVNGKIPNLEARMIRTDRYKYCVYSHGKQRESLVDLISDPGEMINLATNPDFNNVLVQHRALLLKFGKEQNDPLVVKLLENNVQAIEF